MDAAELFVLAGSGSPLGRASKPQPTLVYDTGELLDRCSCIRLINKVSLYLINKWPRRALFSSSSLYLAVAPQTHLMHCYRHKSSLTSAVEPPCHPLFGSASPLSDGALGIFGRKLIGMAAISRALIKTTPCRRSILVQQEDSGSNGECSDPHISTRLDHHRPQSPLPPSLPPPSLSPSISLKLKASSASLDKRKEHPRKSIKYSEAGRRPRSWRQ